MGLSHPAQRQRRGWLFVSPLTCRRANASYRPGVGRQRGKLGVSSLSRPAGSHMTEPLRCSGDTLTPWLSDLRHGRRGWLAGARVTPKRDLDPGRWKSRRVSLGRACNRFSGVL